MNHLEVRDLGHLSYTEAYTIQLQTLESLVAERTRLGTILLVEHPAVITVTRRAGAGAHVLTSPQALAAEGIELVETDRGGDVTYHGPGQLVVYPIVNLNAMNLGIHEYMRTLEEAVIQACAAWGLHTERDHGATGVWVPADASMNRPAAKICAMGVRVKRWISMHGLALNVSTNLQHFNHIVPCGLVGRPVTSLAQELQERAPTFAQAKRLVAEELSKRFAHAAELAAQKRGASG